MLETLKISLLPNNKTYKFDTRRCSVRIDRRASNSSAESMNDDTPPIDTDDPDEKKSTETREFPDEQTNALEPTGYYKIVFFCLSTNISIAIFAEIFLGYFTANNVYEVLYGSSAYGFSQYGLLENTSIILLPFVITFIAYTSFYVVYKEILFSHPQNGAALIAGRWFQAGEQENALGLGYRTLLWAFCIYNFIVGSFAHIKGLEALTALCGISFSSTLLAMLDLTLIISVSTYALIAALETYDYGMTRFSEARRAQAYNLWTSHEAFLTNLARLWGWFQATMIYTIVYDATFGFLSIVLCKTIENIFDISLSKNTVNAIALCTLVITTFVALMWSLLHTKDAYIPLEAINFNITMQDGPVIQKNNLKKAINFFVAGVFGFGLSYSFLFTSKFHINVATLATGIPLLLLSAGLTALGCKSVLCKTDTEIFNLLCEINTDYDNLSKSSKSKRGDELYSLAVKWEYYKKQVVITDEDGQCLPCYQDINKTVTAYLADQKQTSPDKTAENARALCATMLCYLPRKIKADWDNREIMGPLYNTALRTLQLPLFFATLCDVFSWGPAPIPHNIHWPVLGLTAVFALPFFVDTVSPFITLLERAAIAKNIKDEKQKPASICCSWMRREKITEDVSMKTHQTASPR